MLASPKWLASISFINGFCDSSLFYRDRQCAEGRVLQRNVQNFIDSLHRMNLQIGDNIVRNFFQIALVLVRDQHGF